MDSLQIAQAEETEQKRVVSKGEDDLLEFVLSEKCCNSDKRLIFPHSFKVKYSNKTNSEYSSFLLSSTERFSDSFYRKENKLFVQTCETLQAPGKLDFLKTTCV